MFELLWARPGCAMNKAHLPRRYKCWKDDRCKQLLQLRTDSNVLRRLREARRLGK